MRRAALLAFSIAACTCSRQPKAARPAAKPYTGPTGAIEGEVRFTGTPPEPAKLHTEAEPFCARTPRTDPEVLASNGKLQNVWVRVIGAPDMPPPPDAVQMDQRDCMYVPRVAAAVTGQRIVARNGDPVLHNIHAYLDATTLFNRGLPNDKSAPYEFTADEPGLIRWKCDVHPWMRGYVGVSNNPLQAVTGADGAFHIPGVPPGRYTLTAWHEKYGEQSQQVEVQAAQTARAAFTYPPTP